MTLNFNNPLNFNDYYPSLIKNNNRIVILGASGLAHEIKTLLEFWNILNHRITFFEKSNEHSLVRSDNLILGMGNPNLRQTCHNNFSSQWEFPVILHPKCVLGSKIQVGGATLIQAGVVITTDVIIGEGCLINMNVSIGHNVHLEDYVVINPGATISGNVRVGKETLVGANATILENIIIGQRVIIGAGAVVTRDIPDGKIVVGVPAKPI